MGGAMTCKKCGASIKTGTKFCTSCGAPATSGTEQPAQKGRDLRRWLSWGLVSIGMLGLLFIIYLNTKSNRRVEDIAKDSSKVTTPEKANGNALFLLGLKNLEEPKDYKKAAECFRRAAEQGHVNAQYNIGIMYERGNGVKQDYKEALKWYHKAAEQGKAEAQHNIGIMYADGQGVPQDNKKAVKWLRMAVKQGFEPSKRKLESMGLETSPPLPSTDKVKPLDSALKYLEYNNTKYKFKALLPSTWESEVKGNAIVFSEAKNTEQFSTTINFQIIQRTSETTLEGQAQKIRDQWENMKNFKLLSQETGELAGKPAIRMSGSFTAASVNKIYSQEQVIIEHTNYYYYIAYTAPESLFSKYRYIMKKTVESFQFLK